MLNISEITGAMMPFASFNSLVGEEYKPYDLLFGINEISNFTSLGITG